MGKDKIVEGKKKIAKGKVSYGNNLLLMRTVDNYKNL